MLFTYSFIYGRQSFPYLATIFTMALPAIAPSEYLATYSACSGVAIPNPKAHGTSVVSRTNYIIPPKSVLISLLTPVTPNDETQYINPVASFAIILILS